MTYREFYNNVINNQSNDSETIQFAVNALSKLDERNAKRTSTPSKTAVANAPVKEAIATTLRENGEWMTAGDIAQAMELKVQKVAALLRQMTEVEVSEQKIPKKGMTKVYRIK